MMLLQYWPLGMWLITVVTFIGANTGEGGMFTPGFIGYSAAASALGSLAAPVLVGWLTDRYARSELMLFLLHGAAAGSLAAMLLSSSQTMFFVGMIAYFQVYSPSVTLTNTIALRQLADSGREFPIVRLYGTVGWVAAGVFVGVICRWWTGESIEGTRAPLALAAGSHVVMAFYCLTLPKTPAVIRDAASAEAKGGLHRNRAFVLFLLVSLLAAIPSKFYDFSNVFLNQRGYVGAAATMTLGQITEVLCLLSIPLLHRRMRLKTLFLIGLLGWALRYLLLVAGSYGGPETIASLPVLLAIMLHGPSYVFVYLAGQMYVDRLVHPSNRGAAQGLHSMAMGGVGHLLGAGLTGWAQKEFLTPPGVTPAPYDWQLFWLTPVGIVVVVAILFASLFFERPHSESAAG
ncbi:putative nucleoside transporter YegT [Botrimarina colliarenosi]|uniref:Putative nucleoside transporter YegT n=2 Tax=Botrimarina colliarenosi TaxID=2528001 RepID=A0A5C6A7Q1_9BACT|nr:putative nucleoside transporter YegT [Botrimarina colliarenosi]